MYKTVIVNHHKREIWIAKNSYVWYTKREAIKEFKKYLSEKLKKWEG